ncbi:MAG: hypothetical protein NTU73_04530 [Ignavibacteriae bacterium]|nr:hypothetical protein [Ignavibacteriota bacterium]
MTKIKVFIIILQLFVLHFLSCGLQAQNEWSKLEYSFNVGALPPPYHYSYKITISMNGAGELVYVGGNQDKDKNTSKYTFELDNEKLVILENAVKESDVMNLDIKTRPSNEIPDGGHSDGLELFGYSKKNDTKDLVLLKRVPTYPELKYETVLNTLYKVIQNSVPEDIWKEAKSKRDN